MLLLVGTVPIKNLPLIMGEVKSEGDFIAVNAYRIPCIQGTAAMISSALMTIKYIGKDKPQVLLIGDIGEGKCSRDIYKYLIENITKLSPSILVLHYSMPYMGLIKKLCKAIEGCSKKPVMIADAGPMYAAKASGMARKFDIFTPDAAEMSFLADTNATHPAYISKHLFCTDITDIPKLIEMAYQNDNAAKLLLVKGSTDFIALEGKILDTITKPNIPALEAIGGTGDTLTGLVSAFIYAGFDLQNGAVIAARANRMAGEYARATPVMRVSEIINQFPSVFKTLESYIKRLI